jgi:low affinity Fe/Cu permease
MSRNSIVRPFYHRFNKESGMNDAFRKFAAKTSEIVGSPWAFIIAVGLIIIWAVSGPLFGFSDTWQLIANTITTLVTTLMVFLIQNTQNRDAQAIHLKLDELIRSAKGARNSMVDLEDLSDEDLKHLREQFKHLREDHNLANDEPIEVIEGELEERGQR